MQIHDVSTFIGALERESSCMKTNSNRILVLAYQLLVLLPGIACAQTAMAPSSSGTLVFIGTQGDAILGARLNTATGQLALLGPVAEIKRPTWLVVDPKRPILFSVSETGNAGDVQGGVHSLGIDAASGALKPISNVDSGGGGATHLSYDSRVSTVFVANFGTGQVAAIPVQADGSLLPASSIQTDTGTGPKPNQRTAHAHGATMDPGGHFVLTPDMGADRVFVRRFDGNTRMLSPADPPFASTGPGTGPRHLVFSPDGRFVFVLTELSAEVRSFRWNAQTGRLRPMQTLPLDREDFKGTRSAAEILMSRDGRYVYASNRAASTLHVFAVNKNTGAMSERQVITSGGEIPRSFGIDPTGQWMIVGNQISRTLVVFKIDKVSGRLTVVGEPLSVALNPVAFAFFPP
jgi:6-phosphogluconolactonase